MEDQLFDLDALDDQEADVQDEMKMAISAVTKKAEVSKDIHAYQHNWCKERYTTECWLDENEREWYSLDRMIRSRPWATKKDSAFWYPFRECTNKMREAEGKWVGDDQPREKNTRGEAPSDVLTQVRMTQYYPPAHRVLLFTPEFGSEGSFNMDAWGHIEPKDDCDVWAVCWQGWSNFEEMVAQVTQHLMSFGDGINTVWFGQGMGAIVAYEVLKKLDSLNAKLPSLPIGLVVSDCPAPHLFKKQYTPYNDAKWDKKVDGLDSALQQKTVRGDVNLMKSYAGRQGNLKLHVAVVALSHEGHELAPKDAVEAWKMCADEDKFEAVSLAGDKNLDGYMKGQSHASDVDPKMLGKITDVLNTYCRWIKDDDLPDIGPTDGDLPEEVDVLVVGAGICGVVASSAFAETGKSMLVIDKHHAIGGVWELYANDHSRVNTSEPGYHIWDPKGPWSRANEDHSRRRDVKRDLYARAASSCYGTFRLNTELIKIDKEEDETYMVSVRNVKTGKESKVRATTVSLHVNRRIGRRREVDWPNSSNFCGQIAYGYANEGKGFDFWNKEVIIVGAGAFAYENVRTALEHGAKNVVVLGRRAGTSSPKWVDVLAFLRPLDRYLMTNKAGNMLSFEAWRLVYKDSGLPEPESWSQGMLKPHNHTVSVSDLAYIGAYHGMCDTKVGEIECIRPDGMGVQLKDGSSLDCDIILKCTGFHLRDEVPKICTGEYDKMYPNNMLDKNLFYGAEPLLDGGQFGSSKGKIEENEDEGGYSQAELARGVEVLKKFGHGTECLEPRGNPFGSGIAGGALVDAYYFKYLIEHQEEQTAMIDNFGDCRIDTVKYWASQIFTKSGASLLQIVANLSRLDDEA